MMETPCGYKPLSEENFEEIYDLRPGDTILYYDDERQDFAIGTCTGQGENWNGEKGPAFNFNRAGWTNQWVLAKFPCASNRRKIRIPVKCGPFKAFLIDNKKLDVEKVLNNGKI